MANQTQDFTKMWQDVMQSMPMDTRGVRDAFKTQAQLSEKMSKVALEAAEASTEISSKWTKDTLHKMSGVATVKEEPTDYSKAVTDFASAQAESTAETMAAFAEVAKKVQMETVELMLSAGKDMSEDATASMKSATERATAGTNTAGTKKAAGGTSSSKS